MSNGFPSLIKLMETENVAGDFTWDWEKKVVITKTGYCNKLILSLMG